MRAGAEELQQARLVCRPKLGQHQAPEQLGENAPRQEEFGFD
jgi:hypothetical protein